VSAPTTPPRWIDERTVVATIGLRDAIDAIRAVLVAQSAGTAVAMRKSVLALSNGGSLHALGGELRDRGVVGTKTWCHTPGGAQPLVVLSSANYGRVLAVIEAFALGQLRTGATSAIATDHLASPSASVLAMIGTGRQAAAQAAAVAYVRPLREIRVHSRDATRRAAMAARIERTLDVRCRPTGTVEDAVAGADIVTLVTRATAPVLMSGAVEPGTHVNAIGAVTPERTEFEGSLLDRCTPVVADSIEQARALASELRAHFGDDQARWASVVPLCDVVARDERRPPDADVTLFKSLGLGLSDLAVGLAVLERAAEAELGHRLPSYDPPEALDGTSSLDGASTANGTSSTEEHR
jgi:alanine dehydrogenase